MKERSFTYKGYNITLSSYLLVTPKKWRPKVILMKDEGDKTRILPLFWEKQFENKKNADDYATYQTKMYIDKIT